MPEFFIPPFKVKEIYDVESLSQNIPWSISDLNIPDVWSESKGEGITVLVLDTGIEDHEDLKNNVISDRCASFIKTESIPRDFNGHGTASSGVIACEDNATGIVGVAPKVKVIVAKVLSRSGQGSIQAIEDGLEYAWKIRDSIDIINMSLGAKSPFTAKGYKYIVDLYNYGIPIIAAAGNNPSDGVLYPAKYNEVFAVGAYGFNVTRDIANFSAIGDEVDFAAPGEEIVTTWLGNKYAVLQGTSFACPYVAGIVALLLSKYKKEGKKLTVAEIKQKLIDSCIDKGPVGKDNKFGYGIISPKHLILSQTTGGVIISKKPSFWQKIIRLFSRK